MLSSTRLKYDASVRHSQNGFRVARDLKDLFIRQWSADPDRLQEPAFITAVKLWSFRLSYAAMMNASLTKAVVLLALTNFTTGSLAYGDSQPTPEQERVGVGENTGDGNTNENYKRRTPPQSSANDWNIPLAIVTAVGVGWLLKHAFSRRPPVAIDSLLTNGPKFPNEYPTGAFAVQGLVKDGWPIVIDYAPDPQSLVWLDVVAENSASHSRLLAMNEEGRRIAKINLPIEVFGNKLRPVLLTIRSILIVDKLSVNGERGPDIATPVKVHGIGAGPKAVGSIAIDQMHIAPSVLYTGQNTYVNYKYNTYSTFARVQEEIVKRMLISDTIPRIRDSHVKNIPKRGSVVPGEQSNVWDSKNEKGEFSYGEHFLRVRVWEQLTNDREGGDWVAAVSDETVDVMNQ